MITFLNKKPLVFFMFFLLINGAKLTVAAEALDSESIEKTKEEELVDKWIKRYSPRRDLNIFFDNTIDHNIKNNFNFLEENKDAFIEVLRRYNEDPISYPEFSEYIFSGLTLTEMINRDYELSAGTLLGITDTGNRPNRQFIKKIFKEQLERLDSYIKAVSDLLEGTKSANKK